MIWVDTREPESMQKAVLNSEVRTLPAGDYLILPGEDVDHEPILIERKTISDFMGSLNSGNLWEQLKHLRHTYDTKVKVYLLLEGDYYQIKYRKWSEKSLMSIMWSIIADWHIPIIHARNQAWTISWLNKWNEKLSGNGKPKQIHSKRKSGRTMSVDERIEYVLEGLAGPLASRRLLEQFGSIEGVVEASIEDLIRVENIGKKTANMIFDTLHKKWEG